ncbi:putative membrane protein [Streptosporangium canum]|uniref:Putative membrane protein n=1 Tax=Streptosporangium canum TaxID=324952 RepID=A0A1I4BKH9_9ACTN|nr:DUF4142 domain-containing protein [Streptosporangium canum]SFK69225.1 putative membrane protein [Streptosporangium canum]
MALHTPLVAIAATSAAVLALTVGSAASALTPTPAPRPTSTSTSPGESRVSAQDRQFLVQAHQGNLAEIAAGKAAQSKGKAGSVRSIGAMLVADHTKLDKKLQQVAQRLQVTLPTQPTARQQTKAKELAALSGTEFDKAWTKTMIYGHRAALAAIKKEIADGSAPQVKALARASQPVIQEHLDRLLAAEKALGALGPARPPAILTVSLSRMAAR